LLIVNETDVVGGSIGGADVNDFDFALLVVVPFMLRIFDAVVARSSPNNNDWSCGPVPVMTVSSLVVVFIGLAVMLYVFVPSSVVDSSSFEMFTSWMNRFVELIAAAISLHCIGLYLCALGD
jgi:hypothetical protein